MADGSFNIGLGTIVEVVNDGADLEIMLLKVAEADDTLNNYDDVAALLAGSNTEAVFTNYARKTISNASVTVTVDDTNNRTDVDIPDQTWTAAGNGANDTLVKLIVSADKGAGDANKVPLLHYTFSVTTDGTDLTAQIHANGLVRIS